MVAIEPENGQILAQNITQERETYSLPSAFSQISLIQMLLETMEIILFPPMMAVHGIHKPAIFSK